MLTSQAVPSRADIGETDVIERLRNRQRDTAGREERFVWRSVT